MIRVKHVLPKSPNELLEVHNFGETALIELVEMLEQVGFKIDAV